MGNDMLSGHGVVGTREQPFTRLLPERKQFFNEELLGVLANQMLDMTAPPDDPHDGPDVEENLYVPAGYTYLGQFVDHDLTFDTTSSLDFRLKDHDPSNLRTPRFDLDCVYGSGPVDMPYLYASDKAHLLYAKAEGNKPDDLLRVEANGRAIIGDKRNDENSIVCQIQLAFIKFHNAVVDKLAGKVPDNELFIRARNEVRWTYQRILVEDYLKRLIEPVTYDFFTQQWAEKGQGAYQLYTLHKRSNLPIEFVGAAYRFGHSMVRTGYRLSTASLLSIFQRSDTGQTDAENSLIGFQPLPKSHSIDHWGRFFPDDSLPPGARATANDQNPGNPDDVRLQYAYKIDTTLADPLAKLPVTIAGDNDLPKKFANSRPSLALLNLFRGNSFQLVTGQDVAKTIGAPKVPAESMLVRHKKADDIFTFEKIPDGLRDATPLWFYILAEAQQPLVKLWMEKGGDLTKDDLFYGAGAGTQLGPVGDQILLEVFFGLLDADSDSYRSYGAKEWQPLIGNTFTFHHLLKFAGLPV